MRRGSPDVARFAFGVLGVVAAAAACAPNWVANPPRRLELRDPRLAFEVTLATLRAAGYDIVEIDDKRYFLRARSKFSLGAVATVAARPGGLYTTAATRADTWLSFQVHAGGVLRLWATGYFVRKFDKEVHRDVADEMDRIAAAIHANADATLKASAPR